MKADDRIFIAGHRGMVGSALVRRFKSEGFPNVLTEDRSRVDLTEQAQVRDYFEREKPAIAIIAAARVGGIHANSTYPAEFIYENLMIAANCIHAAFQAGVERLLFLGSSCIYPKAAPQPIPENCLLSGPLEATNEAYAVAKIAGLKLCQYYRKQYGVTYHSAMPTNLYGPGDNYHPENSHVIPALIRRFHEAKASGAAETVVWGTGTPRREILHVDDLADACLRLLALANPPDWVNVGTGEDIPILELAGMIARVVGFKGEIRTDPSKPDGTPRKLLDDGRIRALGWRPLVGLEEGLADAYADFRRLLDRGDGRVRN